MFGNRKERHEVIKEKNEFTNCIKTRLALKQRKQTALYNNYLAFVVAMFGSNFMKN